MAVISGGTILPGSREPIISEPLGSPALGAATAVLAATSTAAGSTVVAGITNPDVPRVLTATPTGTAGNVLAVSVVVNGTNIFDQVIAETLPPFTAGALTAVTGVKAFKTVTSVVFPVVGASTNVSIGTGPALGLQRPFRRNAVIAAYLNGVREATAPTVAFSPTAIESNLVTLASALNGTPVVIEAFDAF